MTPLTDQDLDDAYHAADANKRGVNEGHRAGLRAVVALVAARVREAGRARWDTGYEAEEALRAALGDLASP